MFQIYADRYILCLILQIHIIWSWLTLATLDILHFIHRSFSYVQFSVHFFIIYWDSSGQLSFALFLIVLQIIIFGDKVILNNPIEMYVMGTQVIPLLITWLWFFDYTSIHILLCIKSWLKPLQPLWMQVLEQHLTYPQPYFQLAKLWLFDSLLFHWFSSTKSSSICCFAKVWLICCHRNLYSKMISVCENCAHFSYK